ncbi:hypothetical protein GCM10010435_82350 [Winogradskya consettensis]|uniref:Uncharacterized protein n=1 Tax=Winogradskya consettensis TaxID=113560 RepID=A0A919VY43_9ACTN|nr:hypothetical protein [Actinoplanes consettensis]GIM79120.1 hypothetical protein Aco04nite_63930 [Actinoplanes consettensis]
MGSEPLLEPGQSTDAVLVIATHRHETSETARIVLIGEIDMVVVAAIHEAVHTVPVYRHTEPTGSGPELW